MKDTEGNTLNEGDIIHAVDYQWGMGHTMTLARIIKIRPRTMIAKRISNQSHYGSDEIILRPDQVAKTDKTWTSL